MRDAEAMARARAEIRVGAWWRHRRTGAVHEITRVDVSDPLAPRVYLRGHRLSRAGLRVSTLLCYWRPTEAPRQAPVPDDVASDAIGPGARPDLLRAVRLLSAAELRELRAEISELRSELSEARRLLEEHAAGLDPRLAAALSQALAERGL